MAYPVVHWEFRSPTPDTCAEFYKHAFGWDVTYIEELGYHLVDTRTDDGINGGITQRAGPSDIVLYVRVDDMAEVKQRITTAGGRIISEFPDVPNVGAFCVFEDPEGRIVGCWKQLDANG